MGLCAADGQSIPLESAASGGNAANAAAPIRKSLRGKISI
jgi:hypothetical protein